MTFNVGLDAYTLKVYAGYTSGLLKTVQHCTRVVIRHQLHKVNGRLHLKGQFNEFTCSTTNIQQ